MLREDGGIGRIRSVSATVLRCRSRFGVRFGAAALLATRRFAAAFFAARTGARFATCLERGRAARFAPAFFAAFFAPFFAAARRAGVAFGRAAFRAFLRPRLERG